MILEKVPASLRGELTRWLLEPKTGVFVGEVSGMVRDKLWERICGSVAAGGALLIHSADTEQGYAIRVHGDTSRAVVDFDGLSLIRLP
jgi:CRISPR-associated protein Cas2